MGPRSRQIEVRSSRLSKSKCILRRILDTWDCADWNENERIKKINDGLFWPLYCVCKNILGNSCTRCLTGNTWRIRKIDGEMEKSGKEQEHTKGGLIITKITLSLSAKFRLWRKLLLLLYTIQIYLINVADVAQTCVFYFVSQGCLAILSIF